MPEPLMIGKEEVDHEYVSLFCSTQIRQPISINVVCTVDIAYNKRCCFTFWDRSVIDIAYIYGIELV